MRNPLLPVSVVFLSGAVFAANDWFVVPPGTPNVPENPDYRSWATAGTDIHEAVRLSNAVPASDDILREQENRLFVKSGFYPLTNELSLADCRYEIRSSRGAEAQDETDVEGTILCGSYPVRKHRIITIDAGNESRECFVRGLTITNGWVGVDSKMGRPANWGGGVRILNAAGWTGVYDCRIVGNTSFCGSGGGISTSCFGGVVSNCLIACNVATNVWAGGYNNGDFGGGGIMFNEAGGSTVRISSRTMGCRAFDCAISNNLVTGNAAVGGGLASGRAGHWIEGCTFVANRDVASTTPGSNYAYGGTVYCAYAGRFFGCTFVDSRNIFAGSCSVVSNCLLLGSSCVNLGESTSGAVTFNSRLLNCIVDGRGDAGGCSCASGSIVRNCYFADCTGVAGAVFPKDRNTRDVMIENSTFVRNYRGVRTVATNAMQVVNCAFDNTVSANCQDVCVPIDYTGDGVILSNCSFTAKQQAGEFISLANCVFAADPGFVDKANGDCRLTKKSPLREAGLLRDWMTAEAVDLDGKPRVLDRTGRRSAGALPDIGCYECAILSQGSALVIR